MTWEFKALKETAGSLELQVSLGPWATKVRRDQRDRKATWVSLAWRDPWAREGEKAPWDLAVNQGPLGLERKETEGMLVNRVFRAHLVSQALSVPKVPVVLLARRVPQAL